MANPNKLSDMKPAAYNPRRISQRALQSLEASIVEFGDISGLTYNESTGNIIAGHQRRSVIEDLKPEAIEWGKPYETEHGTEADGWVILGDGTRWRVREGDGR